MNPLWMIAAALMARVWLDGSDLKIPLPKGWTLDPIAFGGMLLTITSLVKVFV